MFPPQSGGQLRTANLAKKIAEESDVFVFSFTGRKKDYLSNTKSGLDAISGHLVEWVNRSKLFGLFQLVSYRLRLPPFWLTFVSRFFIPARLLRELARSNQVIIDHPYLYPVLKRVTKQRVLNTHNVEHHLWNANWFASVFIAPWVKRIETKAISTSQEVWCCSEEEKAVLTSMTGAARPIIVVPNFVQPIGRSEELGRKMRWELGIPQTAKVMLFTASQYKPNIDALTYLTEFAKKHQRLLERVNVFILVVGSVSPVARREGRLILTGPVTEVAPYFSVADLAINPVMSGSGTSLKMYEYQAAGIPILSTPFGARGLGLAEGIDFKPFRREELDRVLLEELDS